MRKPTYHFFREGRTQGVQTLIVTAPVDIRQGFDRLAARVREHLGHEPLAAPNCFGLARI
jgi:hypothetical protein